MHRKTGIRFSPSTEVDTLPANFKVKASEKATVAITERDSNSFRRSITAYKNRIATTENKSPQLKRGVTTLNGKKEIQFAS